MMNQYDELRVGTERVEHPYIRNRDDIYAALYRDDEPIIDMIKIITSERIYVEPVSTTMPPIDSLIKFL